MNQEKKPYRNAAFAGGCFWCTESDFRKVDGVVEVVPGYTGGRTADPTYEAVCSGMTGHAEAVRITYDPERISYEKLLEIFWRHVDPTDPGGQFADRGSQYRTAIFYYNEEQKRLAQASKSEIDRSGVFPAPVVTEIVPATKFYPAETYHLAYSEKNPLRYLMYRKGSGRDVFLRSIWGKAGEKKRQENPEKLYQRPDEDTLKARLTPQQYQVIRNSGTEPPFNNAYWDNKAPGIYVDIASGEPLFSALDKFDSGSGWPSFTRPLEAENIVEHEDRSHLMVRTEVRSKHGDSHLGHLFPDGPPPTGQRYCINSASLRFVPKDKLEEEGYGRYLTLFETSK